jgi:hypothetical protein
VSSAFLVAEVTSPDIQLSSLSGNQTWVPLLYMFSAMAVGNIQVRNDAATLAKVCYSAYGDYFRTIISRPYWQSFAITTFIAHSAQLVNLVGESRFFVFHYV